MSKCTKCGGKMNMHYSLWCPKCDKPEPETVRVLDYFKVARYISAQEGWPYEDSSIKAHRELWVSKVLSQLEFPGNDCYIPWYACEDEEDEYESELWQLDQGLRKYFDLKDGEKVLLNISW